jgi:hypothetical protein
MIFKALYYADRLDLVNPAGDVGVVTLWTPLDTAKRVLEHVSPGIFDPESSRIAVVANLYGDGMHQMMCNLLYNPQIRHLIAAGEDLGLPTVAEIEAFLQYGVEENEMLGAPVLRIPGTTRFFPFLQDFDAARLQRRLSFAYLGKLAGRGAAQALRGYLSSLPGHSPPEAEDRVRIEIPSPVPDDYTHRPSDVAGHQVLRRSPLDCWEELVVRTVRFGHPVNLKSGPRLELLNTKVVIAEPQEDSAAALAQYGFSLPSFHHYQETMLEEAIPPAISYTYGNRLRAHFRQEGRSIDTLESVTHALRQDPESRHAFVSLWDTAADLPSADQDRDSAMPCLVTIFFRRSKGRLTLTATYRSHNLLTAWLQNVYGLLRIQGEVCRRTGMPPGPVTVISHSLGIDPRSPRYGFAQRIAQRWSRDEDVDRATGKHSLREDPNGYFLVTVDEEAGELVAEHRYGGLLVKQYRGDRAAKIEREVAGDMAVSLVSHALWLGRELTAKEAILRRKLDRRHSRADNHLGP